MKRRTITWLLPVIILTGCSATPITSVAPTTSASAVSPSTGPSPAPTPPPAPEAPAVPPRNPALDQQLIDAAWANDVGVATN